jgi:hypothetical protein
MNDALTLKELKDRLHPKRFTAMSPKMSAIVAYILGESWTSPQISGIMVTSDGFALASLKGDIGYNDFLGTIADLENNLERLEQAAKLNEEQRKMFALLKDAAIANSDYRSHQHAKVYA